VSIKANKEKERERNERERERKKEKMRKLRREIEKKSQEWLLRGY